jgi:hypothetical protein
VPRAPIRTLPQPVTLTAGPFRGMRDAPEPTTTDPTLALYVRNMVRTAGPAGRGLSGRPGFGPMAPAPIGSTGRRGCQAILTWTDANGVRITTAIVGGRVYGYNWSTDAWTEVVTGADLSGASIALSQTDRVALVPFADGLVVSDGTNVPFHWTGAAGAGGLTKMTNCPPLYGPPTVYYSRLVGIKALARGTFVWSEPGEPNLGYEAGGYNNAWDNPGGYADPLTSVAGTNEALYLFRERIALAITGAVTDDWATAGTRANLSEDVGTLSPWATFVTTRGVIVVDADALPWLMQYGAPEPVPLWTDCRETIRATPRASLGAIQTVQDDATYSVLIAYPEIGQTDPTVLLCFAQEDLQFVGVWNWQLPMQRVGPVVDAGGVSRWAHSGVNTGRLYVHGDSEAGPWNDTLAVGSIQSIGHAVTTASLGYDLEQELQIDLVEGALTGSGTTSVTLGYETPRGTSTPLVVPIVASGGFTLDVDNLDEADLASVTRDRKVTVGLRGRGRWVRVQVRHDALHETFGTTVMRVRAFAQQGTPRSP